MTPFLPKWYRFRKHPIQKDFEKCSGSVCDTYLHIWTSFLCTFLRNAEDFDAEYSYLKLGEALRSIDDYEFADVQSYARPHSPCVTSGGVDGTEGQALGVVGIIDGDEYTTALHNVLQDRHGVPRSHVAHM